MEEEARMLKAICHFQRTFEDMLKEVISVEDSSVLEATDTGKTIYLPCCQSLADNTQVKTRGDQCPHLAALSQR